MPSSPVKGYGRRHPPAAGGDSPSARRVRVLADNFTEIQQAICVARADVDRFHAVNDAREWRADGSLQALIAGHRAKRTESRLRHPAHGAMPRRCVPRRAVRGPRHAPSGASCAAAAA